MISDLQLSAYCCIFICDCSTEIWNIATTVVVIAIIIIIIIILNYLIISFAVSISARELELFLLKS